MKKIILLFLFSLTITTACTNPENALDQEGQQTQPVVEGQTNLSSAQTTISSFEFPHTKPVQVQDAKFEFEIDSDQIHLDELYELDLDQGIENIRNELQNQLQETHEQEPPIQDEAQEEGPLRQPQTPNQEAPVDEPGPQPEQQPEPEEKLEQPEQEQQTDEQTEGIGQEEQRVIELTNQHRSDASLSALQADAELSTVARKKSADMQENNYFSHTSPTYGSPFDMIRDHDVQYDSAGENIAQGQQTPEQAVQGWMDSQGHRENILNGDFTHIGVGYDEIGNHWTQMFISR